MEEPEPGKISIGIDDKLPSVHGQPGPTWSMKSTKSGEETERVAAPYTGQWMAIIDLAVFVAGSVLYIIKIVSPFIPKMLMFFYR